MANKIQIVAIEQNALVESINLNTYLVSKLIKAQLTVESLLNNAKKKKREYNKDTSVWNDVLDENGNNVIEYGSIDGQIVYERVRPILDELVAAFEGAQ